MKWTDESGATVWLEVVSDGANAAHVATEEATASDILAALRANPGAMAEVVDALADDEEWTKRLHRAQELTLKQEARALAAEKARDAALARVATLEADLERVCRRAENMRDVVERAAKAGHLWAGNALIRLDAKHGAAQDKTPGGDTDCQKCGYFGGHHPKCDAGVLAPAGGSLTATILVWVPLSEREPAAGQLVRLRNEYGNWYDCAFTSEHRYSSSRWVEWAELPASVGGSDSSVGVAATAEQVDDYTQRLRVPGGWLYRWEPPQYQNSPGGASMVFVPEPSALGSEVMADVESAEEFALTLWEWFLSPQTASVDDLRRIVEARDAAIRAEALDAMRTKLYAAEAKVARLREALRPFAECVSDDGTVRDECCDEDFRIARACHEHKTDAR